MGADWFSMRNLTTLFALETAVESLSYHGNLLFEELDLLFIGVLQHLEVVHHNP